MSKIEYLSLARCIEQGYLVSFEDLCEEIFQEMLKLNEKIKETNEKFPINLEISEWMPRFDGFFGISSSTDEGDRNITHAPNKTGQQKQELKNAAEATASTPGVKRSRNQTDTKKRSRPHSDNTRGKTVQKTKHAPKNAADLTASTPGVKRSRNQTAANKRPKTPKPKHQGNQDEEFDVASVWPALIWMIAEWNYEGEENHAASAISNSSFCAYGIQRSFESGENDLFGENI
ncbi:hypothetical protein LXL04_020460 [Taraxacum kok-saghyz]